MTTSLNHVEAIVALDLGNGLAKYNSIPWKSRTELQFFKKITVGNIVIMCSNTLLSLPNSMPLKNRINIVVTNNKEKYSKIYATVDNIVFVNMDKCLQIVKNSKRKIIIIGGNLIYESFLPYCSTIWLTIIKYNYNCVITFTYELSSYNTTTIYNDTELEIKQLRL